MMTFDEVLERYSGKLKPAELDDIARAHIQIVRELAKIDDSKIANAPKQMVIPESIKMKMNCLVCNKEFEATELRRNIRAYCFDHIPVKGL